jgi:hypothetical protein
MALSIRSGRVALVALLFIALPAQADDIEPKPAHEPKPAMASGDEELQEPSWIPSIEIGFDTYSYNTDTTIINLSDPTTWSETQSEGADQILFRIGGELMGPMFENLPGRPRLFVQGGVEIPTYRDSSLFELGNPDDPDQPEAGIAKYQDSGPGQNDLPADFMGQGSWLDAKLQDPSWYAGFGIAFSVPITNELLFQIKPSVQYSVEDIDFNGKLKTVFEPPPPGVDPPPCSPQPCTDGPFTRVFEIRQSYAAFSTTDHLIGPGLEVAMGFLSSRPIRISIIAQIRALWLVSDRTNAFTDSAGVASYTVKRDDLVVKGGAGLRFSWVGSD